MLSFTRPPTPLPMPAFTDEADKAEFFQLSAEQQTLIRARLEAVLVVEEAARTTNIHRGALEVERRGLAGLSHQHARRLYERWAARGRDWRQLRNMATGPRKPRRRWPRETEQWLVAELLRNQRKFAPAIRAIQSRVRAWLRTGDPRFAIPGLTLAELRALPLARREGVPKLFTEHALREVEIAPAVVEIVRHGTHAARAFLPHIPSTREGARWLEYITADDVWLDTMTHVPGYGPCKVLAFGFMDFATSTYFENSIGLRPRTPKHDDSGFDQLKLRDFLWTSAVFLETNGYPTSWPMHILLERGTATWPRAQAEFIHQVTDGQVVPGYSGMHGEFVCGWEERARGNSNAKAMHEGFHGILKNEMAGERGQSGKDPDHAPAILATQDRYARSLDSLLVQLPREARGQIVTHYLTLPRIREAMVAAIARIHANPAHECMDFETIYEWRPRGFDALPQPIAKLAPWVQQHRAEITQENLAEYVEIIERRETRAERRERLVAACPRAYPTPASLVPFYEDRHWTGRVGRDGLIAFEAGKKIYRFIPPTPAEALPAGTKVTLFFRPDDEMAHIFTAHDPQRPDETRRRSYLLSWPSEGRLRRDADALTKSRFFARRAAHYDSAYAIATAATAGQIAEVRAEHEHNQLVAEAHGLAPAGPQAACNPAADAVQRVVAARPRAEDRARAEQRETERLARLADEALDQAAPVFEQHSADE